jgi:hypothetical protein
MAVAASLCMTAAAAEATEPSDFFRPVSEECFRQELYVDRITSPYNQNFTRARALAVSRETQPPLVPEQVVDDVFGHPELSRDSLVAYEQWSCRARDVGLNVLPLANVAPGLSRCDHGPDAPACRVRVRNRAVGLAEDEGRSTPMYDPARAGRTWVAVAPPDPPGTPRRIEVRTCKELESRIAVLSQRIEENDSNDRTRAAAQIELEATRREHAPRCGQVVQGPAVLTDAAKERQATAPNAAPK